MAHIDELLDIMARLRNPERGCPWDREQTFASIAPYTLEEAYEVTDAIERADLAALREELGDLLFQVVFHARMAEEQGAFAFADVVQTICDKMQRRHQHVFGAERIDTAEQQTLAWEALKRQEKQNKSSAPVSVLDDVPMALPALTRAAKLGKRASQVGFEWPDVAGALDKAEEEFAELRAALAADDAAVQGQGKAEPSTHDHTEQRTQIEDEMGDVLFCMVNVCRHLHIDPEAALRRANHKFERRFRHVETRLHQQDKPTHAVSLADMDAWWDEAKRIERGQV